ncbi:MAG: hypothetical protein JNM93_04990 [Bacteriovoracaceae bacterium]|nr:hypothetical protein [Bacteriovoracaceae bacterium]
MKKFIALFLMTVSSQVFAQSLTVDQFYAKLVAKQASLMDVRVGDQSITSQTLIDPDDSSYSSSERQTETVVFRAGNQVHIHEKYESNGEVQYEEITIETLVLPTKEELKAFKKIVMLKDNKFLVTIDDEGEVYNVTIDLNQNILNIVNVCLLADDEYSKDKKCSFTRNNAIDEKALAELDVIIYLNMTNGDNYAKQLSQKYGEILKDLKAEQEEELYIENIKEQTKKVKEN